MATKAELEEEVAVLKAQLAAAVAGAEYEDGTVYLYTEGIGFTTAVVDDHSTYVVGQLYMYTDDGEFLGVTKPGEGPTPDEVLMLRADVQRLEIERNDARHQLASARQQLAERGSLHGRIDSLPGVVG